MGSRKNRIAVFKGRPGFPVESHLSAGFAAGARAANGVARIFAIRRVLEISDDVLASKPPQMAVNAATREVIRARAGRVGALLLRKYPSKNATLRIQDEHLDIFCRFAFPLVYGVNVAVLYRTLP